MFELLLNAAGLALSKDARQGANTLIDLMTRSPEWQKEICSIEARISKDVRERADLLKDVIAGKLGRLDYMAVSISAFRVVYQELISNAFDHGTRDGKDTTVHVLVDISPTYVAASVINPKGVALDLTAAIEAAASHLKETEKMGRGRGLLTVYRLADVVEAIECGVKAIVYRAAVEIITEEADSVPIIVVTGGHSNPSLGRRIREYISATRAQNLVLCLDPREMHLYSQKKAANARRRAKLIAAGEISEFDSAILYDIIQFIRTRRGDEQRIRLVCSDHHVSDLLPKSIVDETVDAALKSLKIG